MRSPLLWVLMLTLALISFPTQAADWTIDIVPESSNGKFGQSISQWRPFYVVITNVSKHNLILWDEWCSWGYFNLSFEFADKSGKAIKVQKNPTDFTKNYPAEYVVPPGKHFVLSVQFSNSEQKDIKEWSNIGDIRDTMTMKAIYKNTNEAFPGKKLSLQNKVPDDWQKRIDSAWVGQIESDPIPVTIER